jgi:hypothetical protein
MGWNHPHASHNSDGTSLHLRILHLKNINVFLPCELCGIRLVDAPGHQALEIAQSRSRQ